MASVPDLVIDLLTKSAQLLQEGWCTGRYSDVRLIRFRSGCRSVKCHCAIGAITEVYVANIAGLSNEVADKLIRDEAVNLLAAAIESRHPWLASRIREKAGYEHCPSGNLVVGFNDSTTREDVLAVFRDAITMAYRDCQSPPTPLLTYQATS